MRSLIYIAITLMFCGGILMADEAALTPEITARIQRDTEQYRKGDEVVRVVDRNGRPIEGASVEVEQQTHDFLFGSNIFMMDQLPSQEASEKYRQMFKQLLNYATLPFYWGSFEYEKGKPDYARLDMMARWCRQNGVTSKGHPLIWACHPAGVPAWLPKDKPAEVRRLMESRVSDIVTHYKGLIDVWDVVNESVHGDRFGDMTVFEMTSRPVRWARETNPNALLIVNEYGMFTDKRARNASLDLLRDMKKTGVPFDAIGLQSHMHGGPYPIPFVLSVLDEYGRLGKPLHLTETTVLSGDKETTPDGEKSQAEYVEQFYRACFSHPSVHAVTWWDFTDAGAWQGVAAGLVRKDLTPKPAYLVLDHLINHEWMTKRQGRTDSAGTFSFRGFAGEYRVSVTLPSGKTLSTTFHLTERAANSTRIAVGG